MIAPKLTIKQQAFADYYIELGSASEAYKRAYPNVKKDETARAAGSRLLTNVNVKKYVEERMDELKSEKVADQQEILELLTAIVRGETNSAVLRGVGKGAETIDEDMPPTTTERMRAAELLGKRYAMWTEKHELNTTGIPVFIDDISGGRRNKNGS